MSSRTRNTSSACEPYILPFAKEFVRLNKYYVKQIPIPMRTLELHLIALKKLYEEAEETPDLTEKDITYIRSVLFEKYELWIKRYPELKRFVHL